MGELYIPSKKEVNGPWLISLYDLEELDAIIKEIEQHLTESYQQENKDDAIKDVEKGRYESIEEALEFQKNSLYKKEIKKTITLISKDETRLISDSLKDLLIDPKLKKLEPKELNITIEFDYYNSFSLNIRKHFNGKLKYELKCYSPENRSEISYKIENWIEKKQPNLGKRVWHKYSLLFTFLSFIICLFSSVFINTTLYPNTNEIYKSDALEIIKNGVSDSNQFVAMELILKQNFNYIPEKQKPVTKHNKVAFRIFSVSLFLLIISILKPRTTIGVGKYKNRLKFYIFYSSMILYTIPVILFSPVLIDLIQDFLGID